MGGCGVHDGVRVRVVSVLFLLFIFFFGSIQALVEEIRLGAMFPSFKTKDADWKLDLSGRARVAAFVMAIREINNKTDGIADGLLPTTTIKFSLRDSKRDSGQAITAAVDLIQQAFGGAGIHAVVGCASSGPTMNAQLVLKQWNIMQMSYAASSPALSNTETYPYFARTAVSDTFESKGMSNLVEHFGWSRVATIGGTDSFGADGISSFHSAAAAAGTTVVASVSVNKDGDSFLEELRQLAASNAKVFVVYAQSTDIGTVMSNADEVGLVGPDYVWVLSSSLIYNDMEERFGVEEAARLFEGSFVVSPSVDADAPEYLAFLERWQALPSTIQYDETDGAPTWCSDEMDDDGHYLWHQDHDLDPSTTDGCSGLDTGSEAMQSYVEEAYDAVYAMARAFDKLINEWGMEQWTVDDLKQALTEVQFVGATGLVSFLSDPFGDRESGIVFDLTNNRGVSAEGFVLVGDWSVDTGVLTCEGSTSDCFPLHFNGGSSEPPPDRFPIPCTASDWSYVVSASCDDSTEKRSVVYHWNQPKLCDSGDLPGDKEVDCDMVPAGSKTGVLVSVLAVIGVVVSMCFAAFLYINRAKPVVKFAQPRFCYLFCLGGALCCLGMLAFLGDNSDTNCLIRPWVFHLSLTLMFGPLFVKVRRVVMIFDSQSLKAKMNISNAVLYQQMALLFLADVIFLLTWTIVGRSRAVSSEHEEAGIGPVVWTVCESKVSEMVTLAYAWKAGLILCGAYLAFRARNMDSRFSEATHMMLANYNIAFVGGVVVLLTGSLDVTPKSEVVLQALGTGWCTVVSLACVFVPKFFMLDASGSTSAIAVQSSRRRSSGSLSSITVSGVVVVDEEAGALLSEKLRQRDVEIVDLKREVEKLKGMLGHS